VTALGRVAAGFETRFRAPAPPERLAVLRGLVGAYALVYLVIRLPYLLGVARTDDARFEPVGPLAWLRDPISPGMGQAVVAVAVASGVAFVAGWRWRASGPTFALAFLAVTTYRSSWGQIFHTDNLPALHLLVLAVSPAADAWSLDARRRATAPPPPSPEHGWPVRLLSLLTVGTYAVAGWAKLRNGGLGWVGGDVLRHHIAHDALRKTLIGGSHSSLGAALLDHAWVFGPMAVASLAVELGAPLALLGRRLRALWAVAAWVFHAGVLALMGIGFSYPLSGVAFASLFAVERLPRWLAERSSRRPGNRISEVVNT
jgi:hypothetical protein